MKALYLSAILFFIPLQASVDLPCDQPITVSDNGRLYSAHLDQYLRPDSITVLLEIIRQAAQEGKKVSFAGQSHSQGGHTFCEGGIVIDMRSLNKILKIDPVAKLITVQPGVTWEEIQDAINPYGLSIKVMQASNIFTVGGSLSVNAHGRDTRYGTLIETVRSIKVLKADGTLVSASRTHHPELFRSIIGGYGLFGAIIEAEIELTDNVIYRKHALVMPLEDYPDYFQEHILGKPHIGLHFARVNLSRTDFLKSAIAISYLEDPQAYCNKELQPESHVMGNKIQLFFLRHSQFVKSLRWPFQLRTETKASISTRNQSMRPPVKCLSYTSKYNTDILQEYFIPPDQFLTFAQALEEIAKEEKINLLNVTIRYVPKDTLSLLPYAKEDCFAFVLYITQGLSEKKQEQATQWTRALIDAALACRGTYYLPYQLYATKDQLQKAYPEVALLVEAKQLHDPQGLFTNTFFQTYFKED